MMGEETMTVKIATSPEEKEKAFAIRHEVFVMEQNVPIEIELDEFDDEAIHFLCYNDENEPVGADRKSTRLNSSHVKISYAVFCLKKTNIHLCSNDFCLTEA